MAAALYPFHSLPWIGEIQGIVAGKRNAGEPTLTLTLNFVVGNPPPGTIAESSLSLASGKLTLLPNHTSNEDARIACSYSAFQQAWNGLINADAPSIYRQFTLGGFDIQAYNAYAWNKLNNFASGGLFVGDPSTVMRLTGATA